MSKTQVQIIGDVVFFNYSSMSEVSQFEEVYVWDLDKTYLDTNWQSLVDILKISFADSSHKKNVPGTATLARCIQKHWTQTKHEGPLPLFFITASPPQMEKKIREKLESDQLHPLGIFFKDNLKNVWPGRFRRLTQHVGYKLSALLYLRSHLSDEVTQVLWGDDSETDAVIYSLYSDLCTGRLKGKAREQVLRKFNVLPQAQKRFEEFTRHIGNNDPVEKIYINLAVDTDPEYYLKFGRRLVPTYSAFQICLDLFQDSRLSLDHVLDVGRDLRKTYQFSQDQLQFMLDDMIRRQIIGKPTCARLIPALKENQLIYQDYEPSIAPAEVTAEVGQRVFELEGHYEPWVPERIDYMHDYR